MGAEWKKELLQEGYSYDQLDEIEAGMDSGVDVSIYRKKEFFALQMREIRLGLEAGLSVDIYANPQYDWFQMKELRLGLEAGVDVSVYAKKEIDYDKMRQLRAGLQDGINLSGFMKMDSGMLQELRLAWESGVSIEEYIQEGYDTEQLHEIRIALEKQLDIEPYLSPEYRGASIAEIRQGLEQGLDVTRFAETSYGWQQMREIRLGLQNRVDVSVYSKPLYNWKQMRELRLGLEAGLDISGFVSLMYTEEDMQEKRERLMALIPGADHQDVPAYGNQETGGTEPPTKDMEEAQKDHVQEYRISMSGDEMQVTLEFLKVSETFSSERILEELYNMGIVAGIDEEKLHQLQRRRRTEIVYVIAKGLPPDAGQDGWYEYFFRTELDHRPKVFPDGTVDYQNIEWFEMVKEGQKLALYHDATPGVDGYTVTGHVLPGPRGKEISLLTGQGFTVEEDAHEYYAALNGRVEINDTHLTVLNVLELGTVNLSTGNITFNGSVHVKGDVGVGVTIQSSEDIIVDGFVEGATLISGRDILLKGGSNASGRGYINAGRNITAQFFENAEVIAKDDIEINYCMNCNMNADGMLKVVGRNGSVVGGTITAVHGIEVNDIGNESELATYVRIGVNEKLWKRRVMLEESIESVTEELFRIKDAYQMMRKKYPPEVRNSMDIYLQAETAITRKQNQLKQLKKMREDLKKELGEIENVEAVIHGTVYEGVMIELNAEKWLSKRARNIILRKTENRIAVFEG